MEPALTPHRVVAERIKELRKRRGWSAAHLAAEMTKVGVPWERMVVTKLETGKRQSVTVVELLALAYVLGVSPIHLLLPVGQDTEFYRFTPEDETPVAEMRDWLRGDEPVARQHPGWFAEEAGRGER